MPYFRAREIALDLQIGAVIQSDYDFGVLPTKLLDIVENISVSVCLG